MNAKYLFIAVIFCCFLGNSCIITPKSVISRSKINHVVICWLKEPGNKTQREKIIEVSRAFAEIPGVIEIKAGESIPSNREIVDDSFDVAIMLTFASTNDMNSYLNHPLHIKAKDEVLIPLVKKILVYDFIE